VLKSGLEPACSHIPRDVAAGQMVSMFVDNNDFGPDFGNALASEDSDSSAMPGSGNQTSVVDSRHEQHSGAWTSGFRNIGLPSDADLEVNA